MASNNAYGPQIVTDGLALCLDANNTKSYPGAGSTWYDLSGEGNHLTLYNSVPWSNTNQGGCFTFDGTSDYAGRAIASCSQALKGTGAGFTTVFVFESLDSQTSWGRLFGFGDGDANIDMWQYPTTRVYNMNNFSTLGTLDLYGGGINMWTCTYVPYSNIIYHNGRLMTRGAVYGAINTSPTYDFVISSRPDSGTPPQYALNMNVYSLAVYNRVLSAAEVKQNYNALRSRFGL